MARPGGLTRGGPGSGGTRRSRAVIAPSPRAAQPSERTPRAVVGGLHRRAAERAGRIPDSPRVGGPPGERAPHRMRGARPCPLVSYSASIAPGRPRLRSEGGPTPPPRGEPSRIEWNRRAEANVGGATASEGRLPRVVGESQWRSPEPQNLSPERLRFGSVVRRRAPGGRRTMGAGVTHRALVIRCRRASRLGGRSALREYALTAEGSLRYCAGAGAGRGRMDIGLPAAPQGRADPHSRASRGSIRARHRGSLSQRPQSDALPDLSEREQPAGPDRLGSTRERRTYRSASGWNVRLAGRARPRQARATLPNQHAVPPRTVRGRTASSVTTWAAPGDQRRRRTGSLEWARARCLGTTWAGPDVATERRWKSVACAIACQEQRPRGARRSSAPRPTPTSRRQRSRASRTWLA
jgi:hypothetical protein